MERFAFEMNQWTIMCEMHVSLSTFWKMMWHQLFMVFIIRLSNILYIKHWIPSTVYRTQGYHNAHGKDGGRDYCSHGESKHSVVDRRIQRESAQDSTWRSQENGQVFYNRGKKCILWISLCIFKQIVWNQLSIWCIVAVNETGIYCGITIVCRGLMFVDFVGYPYPQIYVPTNV